MENKKTKKILGVNRFKTLCTLPLFLFPVTELSAESLYAQTVQFSFSVSNSTVKEVLNKIEDESEFVFVYYEDTFEPSQKVTVDAKGKEINEILDEVFAGKGVSYEINDRQVVLKKNASTSAVKQQDKRTIKGIVRDQNGEPIIGANVLVKGTTTGVISDMMGEYQISALRGDVLVVSFIGYKTQEVTIGRDNTINIMLQEDTEVLEEVVVTAFGVGQKKASMVGSVQQVKPSELRVPTSNLSSSFAGRLSGVIAVSRSGEPGADGANFWIRGVSTFSGATNPLIVLDGVEIDAAQLNSLDPEVIESFSVLKDATATALYGTRGANGVMIVTTKKGDDLRKPVINFRVEGAVSQLTKVPEMVDGVSYMNLYNEAQSRFPGTVDIFSQEKIDGTAQGLNPYIYPNVNWYDEMFKSTSFSQRVNFNIRGGSKRVDYFMSASFKHANGNLQPMSKDFYSFNNNINLLNYDFVNNLNIKATSTTTVSLGLNMSVKDWSGPNSDVSSIFSSAINASPVDFPIYFPAQSEEDTHIRWGGKSGAAGGASYVNPIANYVSGYRSNLTTTVTANFRVKQDLGMILKGLDFDGLISYKNYSFSEVSRYSNKNQYEITAYDPNTYDYELGIIGNEVDTALKHESNTSGNRKLYMQFALNYNRKFNNVHDLNLMFLYNQEQYDINNPADFLSALPKRKQGIAGRASYGYANRYLAEVNFGYNGSENFPPNKRFGFFPSVAVGYNISEEKFWENLRDVIPQLKLRASWGLVGNDNTGAGRFAYLEDLTLGGIGYRTGTGSTNYSMSGPLYTRYANNDLTWEVGEKINAGIDLRLFDYVSITADWFREIRSNIFMERRTVSDVIGTGTTKIQGNFGKMQNWGFDAAMDFNKQLNKDWFVSAKGTFTFARNKVLEYDEPDYVLYPNKSQLGYPMNSIWGYLADGLFTQEELDNYNQSHSFANLPLMPGDIKYIDVADSEGNKDGVINENDKVVLGHPTVPEIIYGFGASAKYKNLDFSVFFQGTANVSLMMSGFHPFASNTTAKRGVLDFIAEDYWSEDNPDAAYPRLSVQGNKNTEQNSSYWLRDASFLKLKNAEIGYTFKNMRFYISGNNLLTFSKFKLWDPEMGGGSGMKYPTQRTFNVGFQMTIN